MEERSRDRQEPTNAELAGGDESDGEFEFPFVSRDAPSADELFAGGRIRSFYPVFGRAVVYAPPSPARRPPLGRLFVEEARNSSIGSTSTSSSSSSSAVADAGDLDGVSPDSYCLWTPGSSAASSPSRPPRKSSSTGSMARWRRIGELVIGRSHSDGKEKFLLLSPPRENKEKEKEKTKPRSGNKIATEVDTVTAGHWISYGAPKAAAAGTRRTFLPYRQELVGLFANVNGHSRSHHPF